MKVKEIKDEPKVKRLRTMLNSVGQQLSDQYVDELKKHLEGTFSKWEVATTRRTRAAEPGVLDIVVVPTTVSGFVNQIRITVDPNVQEKGNMIEFFYKESRIRFIIANDLNFHNTVNMVSGFGVLDMDMQNRIQKDGYKLNRYGIWKGGKLLVSNKYDIIRLLDRQ
ncbi:MAG: hypothetical protein ACTSXD_02130 [Candidatus Heimdallarchaeaceae archaeon]